MLRDSGYLLVPFAAALGMLALLPFFLLAVLLVRPLARRLVRLAYAERCRAGRLLGETATEPIVDTGRRRFRNPAYLRSLRLIPVFLPVSLVFGLVVSEGAVHKHVGNAFQKLDLPPTDSGHRRVLAVLTYLGVQGMKFR